MEALETNLQALLDADDSTAQDEDEIADEQEDEQDSLTAALQVDAQFDSPDSELWVAPQELDSESPASKKQRIESKLEGIDAAVNKASEDVIVLSTRKEYERCVHLCSF